MNKTLFKITLIFSIAVVVSSFAFQLSKKWKTGTISAGAPLNYPFVQNWFGNTGTQLLQPQQLPPVDRTQIFANNSFSSFECSDCVTVLMTGDVLPARSVNQKTTSLNNFEWPFEKTAEVLKSADITMINLETPLVDSCPIRTDGMVFCGDQKNVQGLLFAGIDVVNFANNHAGNAGKQGVIDTNQLLNQNGFLVTGIQQPVFKIVKGVKFAFLGYNDVEKYGFVADVDDQRMQTEIAAAKQNADVVIVQFHWGEEYRYQPTGRQKELAHRVIDLGADLVVGNHPHWIEPVEWYKEKLITYSHGNFVFDQMWSTETRQGIVGKYTFQGRNLVDVAFFPIWIENYGQPRWMEGKEKQKILDLLKKESEK
ncbi:MAG: CapA family protein [Patescibacteria group bacterium]